MAWLNTGTLQPVANNVEILYDLPKKIYILNWTEREGFKLVPFADKFTFDFKVYGIEDKFINHVMKTYHNTTTNLGILFYGLQGTSKTVTAKLLANAMELPVIIVNSPYPGLADFLSQIECDFVMFLDEIEKNFDKKEGEDHELLSLMDGIHKSIYRRIFLLTSNSDSLNENFFNRPSRIRYVRRYENIDPEMIEQYLNDNLIYKEYANDIKKLLDSLMMSTIDILKSVVDEVNLHHCSPNDFKDIFNAEVKNFHYELYYKEVVEFCDEEYVQFLKEVTSLNTLDANGEFIRPSRYGICAYDADNEIPIEKLIEGDFVDVYGNYEITVPMDKNKVIQAKDCRHNYYMYVYSQKDNSLYKKRLAY